ESPGDVMLTPWPTVGGNQQRSFYRDGCDGLDNDADGLPDCYELRIGLDPNNPADAESDMDNDSVNALLEYQNGTHPFSANSDGDEFPDAYEILFGMDPTSSHFRGSEDVDFDGAETRVEFIAETSPADRNDAPTIGQLLWRYDLPGTLPTTLGIADDEGVFVNAAVTPIDYGQYDYVDAPRDSIVPINLFGKTTSLGNCNGIRFNLEFEGFNEIKAIGSKSPSILENGALLYSDRQVDANFSRITLSTHNRPGTGHLNGIPTSAYALGQRESRAYVAVVKDEGLDADGEELEDTYALRSMSLTNMGTVWSFSLSSAVNGTPAVGKAGNISFGTADGDVVTLNPDGQELWRFNAGSPLNGHPALGENGTVYIGADNGRLYAVNQDVLDWSYATAGKVTGSPAIASDGAIYVGSHDGFLHVLNSDGSLRWTFETGGAIQASPTLGADGMVYFASDDGLVYAIDSAAAAEAANDVNASVTPVWSYNINAIEGMRSSPVLGDDGVLYVASNGGNVYAIYTSSRGLMDSPWPTYGHDSRNTGNISSGSSEPPQLTITAPTTTNFVEGQAITFEANANDPEDGDLSTAIEWLSNLDGTLGTGAQLVVDMLTVGTHEVTARVMDSDGTETSTSLTIQVDVTSIIVTLLTSAEDSTIVGEVVNLSASITGAGAQTYEYRFRVKGPSTDDKWTQLRDYAPSNLFEWDTTEYLGENILQVLARPADGGETPIKSRKKLAVNEPNPATAVALSTDIAQPQVSGTFVTATALASGNNSGPFDYQFEIKAPSAGDSWMVIQPYGASDTVSWNTDQYFGRNVLRVRARKAGTLDKPVQKRKPFWINESEPATKVTLTADLPSPQTAGAQLTLNAAATGGDKGIYEYQFQVRGPSTSDKWEIIQPYSMEYIAMFNTTGLSGTYDMRVQAREHGTQDRPVNRRIKNFVIQ
ncbi:MAG: PQQ-binding-like beta-propeller repeat protein, partial [Pseudomonadales bacterium]